MATNTLITEEKKPIMHELFLTAVITNDELDISLRILQGICGMQPTHLLRRHLFWVGPKTTKPKGIDPAFITRQPQQKIPLWRTLGEQLARQSYAIQLNYPITRDQFGLPEDDKSQDCDQMFGTLRWNDIPDPAVKLVNSRAIVDIEEEQNLCHTLTTMNHRFTKETIQETYQFVKDEILYEINRYLLLPPNENETYPTVRNHLPPFDTLTPYDAENKWVLTASVEIPNGNDPEEVKRATEVLVGCKTEFEDVFDLTVLDRLAFDTRVKA